MTIRPHDTEQILDTLSEAVELLRSPTPVNRGMIANDLALLHGAVEAEAMWADQSLEQFLTGWPEGARPKPIDVKPSPGHRARHLGGTVTGDDARIRHSRATDIPCECGGVLYQGPERHNPGCQAIGGEEARRRFSRADKRERIADEVSRGEHRDEDA